MNKLAVIMSCAIFMFTAYCMPWTFAQEQIDRKPPMSGENGGYPPTKNGDIRSLLCA